MKKGMKYFNKGDLIAAMKEKTGLSSLICKAAIETFITAVTDCAVNRRDLYLQGFGTLRVQDYKERRFYNGFKGGTLDVSPAKTKLTYWPTKHLRDI